MADELEEMREEYDAGYEKLKSEYNAAVLKYKQQLKLKVKHSCCHSIPELPSFRISMLESSCREEGWVKMGKDTMILH